MRKFPGDRQQAFTALVRPHLDRLYRLAFRLTGTREDAQDLVQDVMLKLYPQVDRLAGIDAPQTWLNRVLYNQFIDDQRRYRARRLRLVGWTLVAANLCSLIAVVTTLKIIQDFSAVEPTLPFPMF